MVYIWITGLKLFFKQLFQAQYFVDVLVHNDWKNWHKEENVRWKIVFDSNCRFWEFNFCKVFIKHEHIFTKNKSKLTLRKAIATEYLLNYSIPQYYILQLLFNWHIIQNVYLSLYFYNIGFVWLGTLTTWHCKWW